ncbi:cryptochrome/photolyase family protein [Cytophagales bacterium LB-30]|uniref:Cryptochrome/photolyase family protein n=1 Tax=Shiella aurantiaca TaxID=3058365 RepID=A0ABT8F4D9_9BACT|nr:cryptochrome/photolyase family protein [Shiella aurantiaca]MDN4165134.1 cryptochrome/photolyase family protein [Shiella aurantiaca]
MKAAYLIFPHQLLENTEHILPNTLVFLIEEFLFFRQYAFHKQKLAFHRASMKFYADYLLQQGYEVHYLDAPHEYSDIRKLLPWLSAQGFTHVQFLDPVDNWLEKRIREGAKAHQLTYQMGDNPSFRLSTNALKTYFHPSRKRFFQTDFYIQQRKEGKILIDVKEQPLGGQWTYDADNRKRYPQKAHPPRIPHFTSYYYQEACEYVNQYFPDTPGMLDTHSLYPTSFEEAHKALNDFLHNRFFDFGPYEDAIVQKENVLHHSILSPLLNTGLLTPQYVVERALQVGNERNIPLNSIEGFIRQIIGWREFVRGMYEAKGSYSRTLNFWGFYRKIPQSFYTGNTGILPIDNTIKKVLKTGYCHHIERLMVLGNFMLLCEFDPDEVYRWFMELFIDSYDWVMVPNVYGMSQFADGGLFATKPYISGSNYLMKMSDYPKGEWQEVWDALFWRFMHTKRDFFLQNPRLGMLVRTFDKMPEAKRKALLERAENYLTTLQ